ncbi:hypothetical protein LZ318_11745 [Saccharopolyspora indica]|uniref:hypothetical protein n=1 Tax=Saccharopolyspora indica TaxID=1229659 RepID=UPI0022EB09DB|nr:hypothetical protein [Saccharopolyspora indica]MDA3643816.1 hypothetical protein [Saccharopolyspora indica]
MAATLIGLFRGDISKGIYDDEDLDDYERQQDRALPHNPYADDEELELELTPFDKPYRLENWPIEDLIGYVGGAKELYP